MVHFDAISSLTEVLNTSEGFVTWRTKYSISNVPLSISPLSSFISSLQKQAVPCGVEEWEN